MAYWLDTNVFIEAQNTYYPLNRVPKFWAFMSQQLKKGEFRCCQPVYDELMKRKDELSNWAKTRKSDGMCIQPERGIDSHYTAICDYVVKAFPKARMFEEFCNGVDGLVIAYAKHFAGTVVTQESKSRKKKVRIPIICQELKVECINTFQLIDRFDPKF